MMMMMLLLLYEGRKDDEGKRGRLEMSDEFTGVEQFRCRLHHMGDEFLK